MLAIAAPPELATASTCGALVAPAGVELKFEACRCNRELRRIDSGSLEGHSLGAQDVGDDKRPALLARGGGNEDHAYGAALAPNELGGAIIRLLEWPAGADGDGGERVAAAVGKRDILRGEGTPTMVDGKASEMAPSVSVGGAVPVPESCIVCVPAASTMVNFPVAGPSVVGLNCTVISQSVVAGTAEPQALPARANGAVTVRLEIAAAAPRLAAVTCSTADLVPDSTAPKSIDCGESVTCGGGRPVPLSLTVIFPLAIFPSMVNCPTGSRELRV